MLYVHPQWFKQVQMIPVGVLPIVSVTIVFLARMAELATKRNTVAGPVRENLTFRLFMLTGVAMIVAGISEHLLRNQPIPWPVFAAGWLCAAASFFIRRQAIAALGRFWSLHVEIRDNHELVQEGPFRWVRHPTYFSMILELIAVGLLLGAWYSLAGIFVLFVPALLLRVRLEESALVEKFGDRYRDYQRTTPAVFPYKGPSK